MRLSERNFGIKIIKSADGRDEKRRGITGLGTGLEFKKKLIMKFLKCNFQTSMGRF